MDQIEMESYLRDYGEDLYCFCRSLSRSREEAEDLYQETFLKLYELADKLEIRTNPKGCLMTISVNLYRNYKKKMAVRHRIAATAQPAAKLLSKEPDASYLALNPTHVPQAKANSQSKQESHLSSADRQRMEQLNAAILSKIKEKEEMKNYGTYCKKSAQAAAAAAVLVLAFSSVSAAAAYHFLNPSQVATEADNQKLAAAFQAEGALFINETQTFADYEVTLLGSTAGKNISDSVPENITADEIYAVLALKRTDGTPMPKSGTPEYAKENNYFPSFYIHGLNPARYNLDGMNGSYACFEKNGVQYYIIAMSNIEMFADKGIYVGLCTAGNDGDYNPDAYALDKTSGNITRQKDFSGVNALFVLPVDKSKADPKQAEKFLQRVNTPASVQLSEEEISLIKAREKISPLVWEYYSALTEQSIDTLCDLIEAQTAMPDKDGVLTYSLRISDDYTDYYTEKLSTHVKDKTPGVLNFENSFSLDFKEDGQTIKSVEFHTYLVNPDGSVTKSRYRLNQKALSELEKNIRLCS